MLVTIGFSIVCLGCGRSEPTEAEMDAFAEGARQAVADRLEAEFGILPEKAEPSKEDLELKEANDIMERVLSMREKAPDGIDEHKWRWATMNLDDDYGRRRDVDGYLPAARWLKAELLDPTPEEVVAKWGMRPGTLPEGRSPP
ncbi:MAG: hypothetical protein HQ582_15515 [Planctomycetes bacterium]|nr:hypothetical protein [Planctomycetota bacterium]